MTEHEKDPMDEVSSPVSGLLLSFLGVMALFLIYFLLWQFILS